MLYISESNTIITNGTRFLLVTESRVSAIDFSRYSARNKKKREEKRNKRRLTSNIDI
jgi:hypothetical protein